MVTPESHTRTNDMLRRIQGEFLEMPGLQLTVAQASRLWGCESGACAQLLASLVEVNFLFQTGRGTFIRVERLPPSRPNAETADDGRTAS
jgi:hypothetical protein